MLEDTEGSAEDAELVRTGETSKELEGVEGLEVVPSLTPVQLSVLVYK